MAGGALDTPPLRRADGVHRVGMFVGRTRLDLDEDDGVPIERDQVDLTDRALVVVFQNAEAVPT